MTETTAPRANHRGLPCPAWCASDHDMVMPSGNPQQNHYGPELWLQAGHGYAVDARLQLSGFSPTARPLLHVYAYQADGEAGTGLLELRSAEDARSLARLVLAVQQMHDGQIAQLAAALEAMAGQLPPDAEL
ncbi:MAG TPA: hypothetical protein VGR98_28040 [Streptosporangiaceae bacterium]|nr:hypothetical protein [Streptosporangiaceae bacterium]